MGQDLTTKKSRSFSICIYSGRTRGAFMIQSMGEARATTAATANFF